MKKQLTDTQKFRLHQQAEDRAAKLQRIIDDMKQHHRVQTLIQPFQDEYEILKQKITTFHHPIR